MDSIQQPGPIRAPGAGRNDLCPCGSGRKHKHCCAAAAAAAAPASPAQPDGAPAVGLKQVRILRETGRFAEAARLARDYIGRAGADPAGHAELGLVHLQAERAAEALPFLLHAVKLKPDVPRYHYWAGIALESLGRDAEALAAWQAAIAIHPKHAEALERLAGLLRVHEHNDAAAEFFRRAAETAPKSVRGRLNQAKSLQLQQRHAEAEALLRDGVARLPASSELKRALAAALSERGAFAEALPLLEAATEGTPIQAATAYTDLVAAKRVTADDLPVVEQMQALLAYPALPEAGRLWLHFGLGKAFDDLGEHAAAMRHFDAGNALAAKRRPFDRAHFGASVQRVIASTDAAFFCEHRGLGSSSELPLLVLGMPRSGTTLVEQILSSHPDVAAGDELSFWNHTARSIGDFAADPAAFIRRRAEEYEALLRRIGPTALRVTDKTPNNFLWIGLFHLAFPRGRVIHCRRDPLDTCLSNYFTNFMAPMGHTYDKGQLAFYYRTYSRMMAHWRESLPPGAMLEIRYEDLVADPEATTRRMLDYAGLPWNDACLRPQDNRRAIRTASQWQARQPTYQRSVERWRRYEPWLGELAALRESPEAFGEVSPASDNAAVPRARRLCEADRLDEAIAALQAALRADGHDPVLYSELGTAFLRAGRAAEAAECFERAIGLSPPFAVAHYNLGAALERLGRADDAVASLRRALAHDPGLGGAWSRLGNLLQARGAQAEALECFRRARDCLTGPADQELEEAKLLRAEGRHAEAEERLRRVVAVDPSNPLAHAMLGDALGEAGRFEEAVAHLRTATDLDPERVGALHNIILLKRVGDDDRPLIARLEAMLARPGRPDYEASLLGFALGKAYDDLGEPEQAIARFDAANAIERGKVTFERADLAARVDRLIAARPAPGPGPGPGARALFIIGMPRSGTTLVEQILSAHPDVAAGGELTFWTDVLNGTGAPPAPAAAAAEYQALLGRLAPGAACVTDKNPFNFFALGSIRAAMPGARFIHCRRDPVDTCLSIYFTRFATPQPFAYDRGDLVFFYRQYLRLTAHWRATTPPDVLLETGYEDLTASPEAQTRRMVAFCGLPWDDACLAPERNANLIRTASIWQARQPIHRGAVARWRRYEPWLGELRELLADAAGSAP